MDFWAIVQAIISIGAVAIGLPSIILWLLGRRDANKKLELDEGALDVSVFAEQRAAFTTMLTEARAATSAAQAETQKAQDANNAAIAEIKSFRQEREEMHNTIKHQGEQIKVLRHLLEKVLERTGETLNTEEMKLFEAVIPPEPKTPETRFGDN